MYVASRVTARLMLTVGQQAISGNNFITSVAGEHCVRQLLRVQLVRRSV